MTIYCLCGYSGVGKTWRRTHDPALKDLPFVDIACIYDNPENQGIQPDEALVQMMAMADELLIAGAKSITLEAFFHRNSLQREMAQQLAAKHRQPIAFIELSAPYSVCVDRVLRDPNQDERRKDARLHLLELAFERGRIR